MWRFQSAAVPRSSEGRATEHDHGRQCVGALHVTPAHISSIPHAFCGQQAAIAPRAPPTLHAAICICFRASVRAVWPYRLCNQNGNALVSVCTTCAPPLCALAPPPRSHVPALLLLAATGAQRSVRPPGPPAQLGVGLRVGDVGLR